MRLWDIVIVGGGPAGAAAAYDLAAQGHRVLVLDKKAFPRFKPCAGGLTIKALARLRFPVSHLIQADARVLSAGYGGSTREMTASNTICAFTIREQFDHYCLNKALEAGAELRQISGLTRIESNDNHVSLKATSGETIRSRFLIGADGAHSQVRKLTRLFVPDRTAIAIEGLLPRDHIDPAVARQSQLMTLDFGAQPLGYGWVFPKADHVNVGLYTYLPKQSKVSRYKLSAYARNRMGSDQFSAVCGYPIATGGENYRPTHPRILLAGDAAGMAESLLGEGIHNAIASGQAAAAAINVSEWQGDQVAMAYQAKLEDIRKDMLLSRRLAPWFYRFLPISYTALTRYPLAHVFMNGFSAGMTLKQCQLAFARFTTEFQRPAITGLAEGC